MKMNRTHIVIPDYLASDIDKRVGKRSRSAFLAEAVRKEVKRLRMLSALERAAGSWKDKEHAELKKGAGSWVDRLRKEPYDGLAALPAPRLLICSLV
jgi:Arc/MetJ-type ribon-helix-helix transcriptional regulator